MTFANIKIDKKLRLMIAASALQLICLAAVALWSVRTLNVGLEDNKKEARRGALALSISADVNALGVNVGEGLLARKFDPEATNRITTLHNNFAGYFEELSTLSNSAVG